MSWLLEEIRATPALVRAFDPGIVAPVVEAMRRLGGLLIIGEGSSRIFPAGRAAFRARWALLTDRLTSCGAREAVEFVPSPCTAVLALSRSGKTPEVLEAVAKLREFGHDCVFLMGAMEEHALAATRSVVGEGLLVDAIFDRWQQDPVVTNPDARAWLADHLERALAAPVPREILAPLAAADTIWVCGRSDGVAEELALKACEIARKRAVFLEGTRFLHGLKTVIRRGDALLLVDPFREEVARFADLAGRLGAYAVGIAATALPAFPTLVYSGSRAALDGYLQLATGWTLLVALGKELGTDLDGRDLVS